MTIFFISDTHYHHGNMIKYSHRPFLNHIDKEELKRRGGKWHNGGWKDEAEEWTISQESIEMMNKELVDQINKMVGKNDTLYHLGDFGICPKSEERLPDYYRKCREIRDKINCNNIHLIIGNHDHPIIYDLFSSHQQLASIDAGGKHIVLCHYAMATWDRSHRGAWHLYGHSHSAIETWMDSNMPGRRSIDVGVDNIYLLLGKFRPVSLNVDLPNLLGSRRGFSMNKDIPTDSKSKEEGS